MKAFKFHFDSINIAMREAKESIVTEFKFHFDSINMITKTILDKLSNDLNSTLILLIY